MPYQPLSSGKKRIILGLMTFGPDKEQGARVTDLDEFKSVLDYFQRRGYNEVDTAYSYVGGKQQEFTRAAGWKQRQLHLATKFYPNDKTGGHDAANIRAKCEENLHQLGADSTNIFYLHKTDRNTNFAETLEECNELYKEGKFEQLGLSNFSAFEIAECVMICNERGWVRPTIFQGMYNAITRSIDLEVIVACRRYGIDVVIYNPLAGGLLSGRLKSLHQEPEDELSRFGSKASTASYYRERYYKKSTFEALEMITRVTEKHHLSVVEVALRWLMHHSALNVAQDGGDGILIGVSSQTQLENNLRDLEKGPLPDEVVDVLDKACYIQKRMPHRTGTVL